MASDHKKTDLQRALKLLKKVEAFKAIRNALTHSWDVGRSEQDDVPTLIVELVGMSGKEKTHIITPASHKEQMKEIEQIFSEFERVLRNIEAWCSRETLRAMQEVATRS